MNAKEALEVFLRNTPQSRIAVNVDAYLSEWEAAKSRIIKRLGDHTVDYPIEHTLTQNEIREQVAHRIGSWVYDHVRNEDIISGIISRGEGEGAKTGRYIRKLHQDRVTKFAAYEAPALLKAFDQSWSALMAAIKTKGTIRISVAPVEFLMMADHTSGWTSCMSNKGGTFPPPSTGAFTYGVDPYTIIAYLYTEEKPCDYLGGLRFPVKKWRVLIHMTRDWFHIDRNFPAHKPGLVRELAGLLGGGDYPGYVEASPDKLHNSDSRLCPYYDLGWGVIHYKSPVKFSIDFRPYINKAADLVEAVYRYTCGRCNRGFDNDPALLETDEGTLRICARCYHDWYFTCAMCGIVDLQEEKRSLITGDGYPLAVCYDCCARNGYVECDECCCYTGDPQLGPFPDDQLTTLCRLCITRLRYNRCRCGGWKSMSLAFCDDCLREGYRLCHTCDKTYVKTEDTPTCPDCKEIWESTGGYTLTVTNSSDIL